MDKHKFEKNKKYYTISMYVLITFIVAIIAFKLIWNWGSTLRTVHKILDVLSPFLIGIFIAYLMNPLVKLIDGKLLKKIFRIKSDKIRKFISILFSYVIVLGIIGVCISIIVPEIYSSLKNIYDGVQGSYITSVVKDNSSKIIEFVQGSLDTILPLLYNTSMSVISWVINLIIAIMVSCYMLIDKQRLLTNCKKVIYVIFKKSHADKISQTLSECNKIFGKFIVGKTIDSTIIGFLCFLFMNILGLKYSMLISVIVGITNMIPYFGPFIGAVPGVLILLTIDWKYALVFGVLILALQQFDGLYLGPKILGESTGLRPVWIIFAITVGGWLAGPIGMFLGVPCVAVIAFLTDRVINRKLTEKNITVEDVTVK